MAKRSEEVQTDIPLKIKYYDKKDFRKLKVMKRNEFISNSIHVVCIRKGGSNGQILRQSQGSISKVKCFCWPKMDISSLLHSKCSKWNSNSSIQDESNLFWPVYFSRS